VLFRSLALRNARHHNKARRVRSLYNYHAQEAEAPGRMEQYLFVDFPAIEEGADSFNLFLSWLDFDELLEMPQSENRLAATVPALIKSYLNSEKFEEYADYYGLGKERVVFNVVPLIVNAGFDIVPSIHEFCSHGSTEAKFFLQHFTVSKRADTRNHEVECGPFVLPD